MHYPLTMQHLFLIIVAFFAQSCPCASPTAKQSTPQSRARDALPRVTCTSRRIRAVFGHAVRHSLLVKDRSGISTVVPKVKEDCGVRRGREKNGALTFYSRYDSCYAHAQGDTVVISLVVQLMAGEQWYRVNISCPLKKQVQKPSISPTVLPGQCNTQRALHVDCGPQGVPSDACLKLGCCYDDHDSTCYYRMNACSLDGHFVFSVKAADTDPPLNPSSLVVRGQPHCFPVVTNADTAVFKIGVMECGTKMVVNGDVVSYEVELEERQTKTVAKYSPFSLQVQCQYEASALLHKGLQLRYPTNLPPVTALGTVRVQMRIATDESFTSFLPEDQLPLTLTLRKPAYVEVSISPLSPDPSISLRVRDCFAYPASRHSVWTLLYDGCPNLLDNMRSSIPEHTQGKTNSHSQVRRFDVKTFAFFDPATGQPSVEEMYFYCWVEICTEEVECEQDCSITPPEGERQRRESGSDRVQLVSAGPLLLDQNTPDLEGSPESSHLNTVFQVSVFSLSAICSFILFFLLFSVWWRSPQSAEEEASNAGMETRNNETSQQAEQSQ